MHRLGQILADFLLIGLFLCVAGWFLFLIAYTIYLIVS